MGTYGVTKLEKELEKLGYDYYAEYKDKEEAKEKAKALRTLGYRARVVESSSGVVGYYSWDIFYKKK